MPPLPPQVLKPPQFAASLGGKERGVTQALPITFALSCGFEDSFGQRGLLHRGLLLWRKGGPSIV